MSNKTPLSYLATQYIIARRSKIDSKFERNFIADLNECKCDDFCWSRWTSYKDRLKLREQLDNESACNECMSHERAYRKALKDCANLLRRMERLVNKRPK